MNLPNKLTVLRIILTPIFMAAMLCEFPHHMLVALIIFIGASITDCIDGNYARKHNMVTAFGKFLDPLADKMLTTAALLGFLYLGIGGKLSLTVILFIVLFREFLIASLRLAAVSSNGKVIAANVWGKLKTVMQMVAIITAMAFEYFKWLSVTYFESILQTFSDGVIITVMDILVFALLWISAILAAISGVIYLIQSKDCIDTDK